MTPNRFRWGLLFITAGVILLLNQMGYLDWEYWWELLLWWPVLLIAIGIEKIFNRTRLQFISYVAPLILVAGMIYVAVDVGPDTWRSSFGDRHNWNAEMDSAINKLDAVIDHGRTDLTVSRSGINLASAKFDRFSQKPDITLEKKNNVATLDISRSTGRRSAVIFSGHGSYQDWRVSFSDEVPLELRCIGHDADVDLNLESIPIEKLSVVDDGGNIYLKVGNKTALVAIDVSGNDADLRIRIPADCGIKITGKEYAPYLKDLKLIEEDAGLISEGFNEATTRISFNFDDGLRYLSMTEY
ncbi:MAG: DUF5668 domain-containing protein [Candidatus Zixiibacteriota bacterium]